MREPKVHPSARKHGISAARMLPVVAICPLPMEHLEATGQVIFLGPDQNGVAREVVAFEDDDGELIIIHAMRLRPSYRNAYEEVMRWR